MATYVYHSKAYHKESDTHIDTISRIWGRRILTYQDYQSFKKGICEANGLEYEDGGSLIIESLSFLHKEDGP